MSAVNSIGFCKSVSPPLSGNATTSDLLRRLLVCWFAYLPKQGDFFGKIRAQCNQALALFLVQYCIAWIPRIVFSFGQADILEASCDGHLKACHG